MSETDDEGEAHVQLEDERKLMRSVLAQFDAGAATTEQPDAKPPVEVGVLHHITAVPSHRSSAAFVNAARPAS